MTAYQRWEKECDDLMVRKHGVGIDDIPDMLWHDWWKDGYTVASAVQEAIDITNKGDWI